MTLDDMNHREKLALIGLARLMVRLDHEFTEDEASALAHLIDELGSDQFWKLVEETSGMDDEAIREIAVGVARTEAQEMIYGSLYEVAIAGSVEASENDLLEWLEDTWDLDIQDVPAAEEE